MAFGANLRSLLHIPNFGIAPSNLSWPSYIVTPTNAQFRTLWNDMLTIPSVWAAMREVSESLASVPIRIYKVEQDSKGHYKLIEDELPHIRKLFSNSVMSEVTVRETQLMHLTLTGNSYNEIEFNHAQDPIGVWPVRPDFMGPVRILRDEDGVPYKRFDFLDGTWATDLSVFHIPGPSWGGYQGIDPVELFGRTAFLGVNIDTYGTKFFRTGRPLAVLESEFELNDNQKAALRKSFDDASSQDSLGNVVLPRSVEYKPVSAMPDEAQFNESRVNNVLEWSRVFRVPPSKLAYMEHSTYNNLMMDSTRFVRDALLPVARKYEAVFKHRFLPEDYVIRHDLEELLAGTAADQANVAVVLKEAGIWSVNEARIATGKPPRDEAMYDELVATESGFGDQGPNDVSPNDTAGRPPSAPKSATGPATKDTVPTGARQ